MNARKNAGELDLNAYWSNTSPQMRDQQVAQAQYLNHVAMHQKIEQIHHYMETMSNNANYYI